MPFLKNFVLPSSALSLPDAISDPSIHAIYLVFISSNDPQTGLSWCPDVRAALPVIEATFSGRDSPTAAYIEVGQRPIWKSEDNVFRTTWSVNNVPTITRYERKEETFIETGRLVEDEILDEERSKQFIKESDIRKLS